MKTGNTPLFTIQAANVDEYSSTLMKVRKILPSENFEFSILNLKFSECQQKLEVGFLCNLFSSHSKLNGMQLSFNLFG